jgi:hypothetical protein
MSETEIKRDLEYRERFYKREKLSMTDLEDGQEFPSL